MTPEENDFMQAAMQVLQESRDTALQMAINARAKLAAAERRIAELEKPKED